jgi:hypothetical protein
MPSAEARVPTPMRLDVDLLASAQVAGVSVNRVVRGVRMTTAPMTTTSHYWIILLCWVASPFIAWDSDGGAL